MDNSENLTAMMMFARVVECRSFSEAARALGLSKSHVSREIARLEVRLGFKLLHRTTRNMALTELGQAYYPFCTRMLAEMHRADTFVQQLHQNVAGSVRLQAPVTYGCQCVSPALNLFLRRHIHINVDLDLTDRGGDELENQVDIVVAIRARAPQGAHVRLLGDIEWGLYAAPDYLAQRPPVTHPDMLP
ncbi:MAG TPA: LysR family transcriptional regulator, partial [Pantoea sp.]|nr:LysR family transcriptional regulator [Pantoea sp.]